jgi:hypothetical protein
MLVNFKVEVVDLKRRSGENSPEGHSIVYRSLDHGTVVVWEVCGVFLPFIKVVPTCE